MRLSTTNFYPLSPVAAKFLNFALQILVFLLKTHCSHHHKGTRAKTFIHNMGTVSSLPKKNLGPKLMGYWLGKHPKIWDPYLFLQPLKLATSNLVYNLGLGSSSPRSNFYIKISGGLGQGSIQKYGTPLLTSAAIEASNVKFGTQLGFGD